LQVYLKGVKPEIVKIELPSGFHDSDNYNLESVLCQFKAKGKQKHEDLNTKIQHDEFQILYLTMYKILITINCISIAKIHRKLRVCSE
jgi:hypothetical protein